MKHITRLFLVALAAVVAAAPVPGMPLQTAAAQPASQAPDLAARLAAIEKAIDAKRIELGIPGASLVIVKDDKVVFQKGFGLRDVDRKLPVTTDTLFAIGSSTKAFTAMSVVMAADDGKLSLDDSPSKYLPYFTMADPDAAQKITIRDLLCHRSGLNRTDLAWVSGQLNREEIIRVAGKAKPTAKLGEKFQYQNVMFIAAGEIAAKVEGTSYEELIARRIFKPLGMTSSTLFVKEMQSRPDHSLGYEYNFSTKTTRELPTRVLQAVAPAGAINSNAKDMAQWLRVMLGGGVFDGKRLVSEAGYTQLISMQMEVTPTVGYGLGWFLRTWNGHKIVEHGGNIDGFNAAVAMMPDEHVGFVLLTNVTASSIGEFAMATVWKNLVGTPDSAAASDVAGAGGETVDPQLEAGTYLFREAGLEMSITFSEGKLTMTVPGQPPYPLERVSGRRYKLGLPAPEGFFATFRPIKDKPGETEIYLEQPQGNYVLPRKGGEQAAAPKGEIFDELTGVYDAEGAQAKVEISTASGSSALVVPGQPAYPLKLKAKDAYVFVGLPDTYELTVKRAADGAVTGFALKQPNGTFNFTRAKEAVVDLSVDELWKRIVDAAGGEAAIRKYASSTSEIEVDLVNQGVTGTGTTWAKAPAATATSITLTAFGKTIGTVRTYFDGAAGGEEISFAPTQTYSGRRLEDERIGATYFEILNWKTLYKSVVIRGKQKLGDEEAYVVVKTPEKANPVTDYYSTKDFRLLRRDSIVWSDTANTGLPSTSTMSDYRQVEGVWVPFMITTNNIANGDIVVRVKSIKLGAAIDDAVFRAK